MIIMNRFIDKRKSGECSITSKELRIGFTYGDLPTPTKKGYTFDGWYVNDTAITSDTVVQSKSEITAKWSLKTSIQYTVDKEFSAEANEKMNPFSLVFGVDNTSGSVGAELDEIFDFDTLKAQGYKMRILVDYKVKRSSMAILGLDYKLHFTSGGKSIATFNGSASTSYQSCHKTSDYIDISKVDGAFSFYVSTENVFPVYVKNVKITIEFTKD